jgi:hypothetical protein
MFLLLAMVLAVCAHAADITATLETGNLRLRRGGPIPLEVRFQNPTPRLLEGRIEVTLLLGDRKSGVQRSRELLIEPGARMVPVLLAPPADARPGDGIAARLRWIGADGTRDFGMQQLGIYGIGGHEVVLGIVRTERRLTELDHAREASLGVESLRPKLDAAGWLTFTTLTAPIAAGSLPAHPSGWCAYDAVFLDGPAFAAANEKQLAILARWIEAGGSLWICADVPAQERHAAFLDALCAKHGTKKRCTPGEGGRLSVPGREPFVLRPGLGTAVIVTHTADEKEFARNPWRAAVAEFWKLPAAQVSEVAANGVWDKDWAKQNRWLSEQDDGELRALWLATSGLDALRPGAPRLMPLALVGGTLAVLLLCVGPGDYLLLGWLRRRRWTWLLFPAFCTLCGWWMWRAAERSIGTVDRRGTVRLVDVARDGRVLREVRYEFLLPARDREWEVPVQDGIAVAMPRAEQESDVPGTPNAGITSGDSIDAALEWESTSVGRMKRSLRQWTPALVRVTSFPANGRDDSGAPWDALEARNARFQSNKEMENVVAREPVPTPAGMHCWSHSPGWGALPSALDYRFLRPRGMFMSGSEGVSGSRLRTTAWMGRAPGVAGTLLRTMEDDNAGGTPFLLAWRQEGNITTIYRRFRAPPEP